MAVKTKTATATASTTKTADQKTIERMFKMLQLTNSPNEGEAALAASRLAAALAAYNLTEADILAADPDRKSREIKDGSVPMQTTKNEIQWCVALGGAVAATTFCRDLYDSVGCRVYFAGTEVNRNVALGLYQWLETQVLRLAETAVQAEYRDHRERMAELAAAKGENPTGKRHSTPEILDALAVLLGEIGPTPVRRIAEIMLERGLPLPTGKIAEGLWARMMADIKQHGMKSRFRAPQKAVFSVVANATAATATRPDAKVFRRSYLQGCCDRVAQELRKGFRDYVVELDKVEGKTGQGTELVKASHTALDEWLKKTYPASKTLKIKSGKVNMEGYFRGHRDGEQVELSNRARLA